MTTQSTALRFLSTVPFLFAAACQVDGTDLDDEADDEALEEETGEATAASSFVDLRFGGVQIEANGVYYPVAPGGSVNLPCTTSTFRVHYSYENHGDLTAPAHQHTSVFGGPAVYMKPVGALPGGVGMFATFIHSIGSKPANIYTSLSIKLDDPSIIGELYENNNAFSANVRRICLAFPI